MQTAYLTLDPVNAGRAIELGARCGHAVHLVDLRSTALAREPLLILDLDHLPAAEHPRLFALLLPRPRGRLAVHSYNLAADTIRELLRAGVVVRQRLDATVFRRLREGNRKAVSGR
jgi:hypothetical protein